MVLSFIFSILIGQVFAETKYVVLETTLGRSCQDCPTTSSVKDDYIKSYAVRSNLSASSSAQGPQSYEINLNREKFQVQILDTLGTSNVRPIFKFKYAKSSEQPLYSIFATEGTSSRYYHYFLASSTGIVYLGLTPELDYNHEKDRFYSIESDGPKKIFTEWVIKEAKLQKYSQEIYP